MDEPAQSKLSDTAEAVLFVLNGHIPGSAVERRKGRDLLITKGGMGVDIEKLATEIAGLLDMVNALPR